MQDSLEGKIAEEGALKLELIRLQEREKYHSRILADKVKAVEEKRTHEDEREKLKREIKEQNDFIGRVTLEMNQLREYIDAMQNEWKHKLDFEKEFINAKYKLEVSDVLQANQQLEKVNADFRQELFKLTEENLGLRGGLEELLPLKPQIEELKAVSDTLLKEKETLTKETEKLTQDKELIYLEFTRKIDEILAENKLNENKFELRLKRAREEGEAKNVILEKTITDLKMDLSSKRQEIEHLSARFSNRERNYIHRIYEIDAEHERSKNAMNDQEKRFDELRNNLQAAEAELSGVRIKFEQDTFVLRAALKKAADEAATRHNRVEELEKQSKETQSLYNSKIETLKRAATDATAHFEAELKIRSDAVKSAADENLSLSGAIKELKEELEKEQKARMSTEDELSKVKASYALLDQEYHRIFRKARLLLWLQKPIT